MRHSEFKQGESYETGTRAKYRDAEVASNYHREFTRLSLSPNDLFVRLVTRGERRAIALALDTITPNTRRIADIPCGTGKLLPLLGVRGFQAVAGDVSIEMMHIARGEATRGDYHPAFVQLDATRLPFATSALDAAVCLRLLHRVPTEVKRSILQELHRVARRYAIVSYGIHSPWHAARGTLRSIITGRRTVPFGIKRSVMTQLLAQCGWRVHAAWPVLFALSSEHILLLEKERQ